MRDPAQAAEPSITPMPAMPAAPETPASAPAAPSSPAQRRALGIVTLLAVAAILRIAMPVGIGVLLGMLAAFIVQPLYARLLLYTRRPELSALSCVAISAAGILGFMIAMGSLLVGRGVLIGQAVLASLGPGGEGRRLAARLTRQLARVHMTPDDVLARVQGAASELTARAARLAAEVAGLTLRSLLGLFFIVALALALLRTYEEERAREATRGDAT